MLGAIAHARVSMDDGAEVKKLFRELRPVCVAVLRSLSSDSLARLDEELHRFPRLPPPIVEYVLFPLRAGLRRLGG